MFKKEGIGACGTVYNEAAKLMNILWYVRGGFYGVT